MADVAVRVERLSKRYRVGARAAGYGTLREAIVSAVRHPLWMRRQAPDEFWALHNVSFEVPRGQVLGIVGRNGAGKSTLLKLLSRVTRPTSGRAEINGRVGSLLEVGTGFHPELTGRENIYLNGAVLGMPKVDIDRNLDAIIDFAEIERFLDMPVKRYSSGMYMRLAFSIAAYLQPDILVVDEVLAVGDAAFQKKCLGKIGDVAQTGRTVLFVSHSMPTVLALCDEALLLHGGELVHQGSPAEVVRRYLASQMTNAAIPLDQRRDRSGDGSVRLVSLRIESTEPDGVIQSSSQLKVVIQYHSATPVRQPQFVVSIYDSMNVGIFVLHNEMGGGLPSELPSDGTVTCITDPINLTPGRCIVHVELLKGNVRADYISGAGSFDVEPDETFGAGPMVPRNWALCLLRHRWHLD